MFTELNDELLDLSVHESGYRIALYAATTPTGAAASSAAAPPPACSEAAVLERRCASG